MIVRYRYQTDRSGLRGAGDRFQTVRQGLQSGFRPPL